MYFYLLTRSRFHSCIFLCIFLILCGYPSYSTRIFLTRPGDSLDVFTVQRTNCNDWCLSKQSQLYNTSSSCACRCNSNASTFVYKVDLKTSTCVDNVEIRQTLGQCKVLLDPNDRNSPLSVFNLSTSGSKVLTGINGSSVCSVVKEQFLENGIWVTGNLTTFTTQNNLLKWSSQSSTTVPPYAGRIVKVDINCGADQSCVIFKVQGTFSYNVSTDSKSNSPTSISLQPSPTVHLGSTQTSTVLQVNHSTSRHYKTKNTIRLEPATISPTLATIAMVTSSAILIDTGGTKTVLDRCERGAWVFCQRVYLVIAAAGTVVLVAVGIILISFACIRRRRRNLNHQMPVFFKSGLTKETDSSTELALIEDAKPVNEDHSGQNTVEALYQNVPKREKPDKNQLYRPLRSSDGQDSPTSPISQGRFSSASSTNDETSYDDNTDSNQLIKPQPGSKRGLQFKTFCPSPVIHSKKDFVSKQAVLDVEEEQEPTYEIMEKKTILPNGKTTQDDTESMTGIENQVFEEDDKRQSHYEGITTDETDEQPNYENLGEDLEYSEEQPDYETMEEHLHGQHNGNDFSDLDEEQVNYETMEDCSDVKQPNDQHKTALLYKQMGSHNKNWDTDNDSKKDEEMEYEQQYDIPEINGVNDRNYDIPELSVDIQEQQDEPDYHYALNKGTGLTVPSNTKSDDDDDNDTDYIYANVPETQANALREKLKLRNSWHSSGQRGDEGDKLGTQAADEKPGVEKNPTSRNDSRDGKKNEMPKTHEEDEEEELYTLPDDYPKALPSCLLKGRSSPQMKGQASPKQRQKSAPSNGARQAVDQDKPKTKGTKQNRGVIPDRTRPDSPKTTGKIPAKSYSAPGGRAKKHLEHFKEGRISPESMAVKKGKTTSDHPDSGKEDKALRNKEKEDLPKSNGGTPSPRQTNSRGKDKPTRRKQQPKNKNKTSVAPQNEKENYKSTKWNQNENEDNKITGNDQVNILKENHVDSPASAEQPLYTNILEMQKEAQPLANHNADFMEDVPTGEGDTDDQQPLYENLN